MGRQCLSVTQSTSAIHRDGLCCIFLMVRPTQSHTPNGRLLATTAEVQKVSTVTLLHLLCVFYNTAHLWVKNCMELLPSSYNTSRFDQPLQAAEWLRNFRITNEHFLSKVITFHCLCEHLSSEEIDTGCN